EHRPLADAVGEDAPRDHRERRPGEGRSEEGAGLAEAEAVAVPERGRHHGDAEPDRGPAGLGNGARAEDDPAVAHPRCRYRYSRSTASAIPRRTILRQLERADAAPQLAADADVLSPGDAPALD